MDSGDLYIAGTSSHCVRKVDGSTGIITTVAGNGAAGYSGDGGPATQASLNGPYDISVNSSGDIYIGDYQNSRIRRVDGSTGIITTVAGNGSRGYSGDGGLATQATLNKPPYVTLDVSGNLYISDHYNHRIRKIDGSTGIITTVAGNGSNGFSGDGGPATQASLYYPSGVSVTASGDLYISDKNNQRIRKVDGITGTITTVAGDGSQGYSGDGGPAILGSFNDPQDIFATASGDIYIADLYNHRVRLVATDSPHQEITVTLPGGATMDFVWIESGTFMMGSPDSDAGAYSWEKPQHEVTISKGFYLGKYEITQAQWESVMEATPWSGQIYVQSNPNHPAVFISGDDVQTFVQASNNAAGQGLYRLPTGAEWEYACRAGTTTRWSFGDDAGQVGAYAWYASNAWNAGERYAHAVGTKLPNPWGVYDMHGNVAEWTQDWYGPYTSAPQTDPTGPATGTYQDLRGGDFNNDAQGVRAAYRSNNALPGNRVYSSGARLVMQVFETALVLPDVETFYNQLLQVPVHIGETSGAGIVSAELFVSYDSDLLTPRPTPATTTTMTAGWALEHNIEPGDGTPIDVLKIAMATDENMLMGSGDLVTLHFDVADRRSPAMSPLVIEHALLNDGTPGVVTTDGSVTLVGTNGVIASLPSEILPRWSIGVSVYDLDEDRNTGTQDAFDVGVTNGSQTETLTVTETGNSTGAFSGVISTAFSLSFTSDDGIVQARAGDQIIFSYADSLDTAGNTQIRTDVTDVLGGTDGLIRATVVSQPGDTVRVRVSDADLSDAVAVSVANPRTGEAESILLSQFTSGESYFYGRFFTDAQTGAVGDSTLEVTKGDVLSVTYADTLTAAGGMAAAVDDDEVVDPFGDAHPNGNVQAFDAAQVLIHRLSTYSGGAGTLSGLDSLSANVDQGAPLGIIDGYDASLILRKVVGLISRFEVQEPDAINHPQPETSLQPKPVLEERRLALVPGEGYVSVWCEDRGEIVSGELTLAGVKGQVVMGEELQNFLTASQATEEGLQVVFAGTEAVSGTGELLRITGVEPGSVQLTRGSFNGGQIGARWEESAASVPIPKAFALYPNMPNPFNPETVIRFALAEESQVRLEVFDAVGQRVRVLVGEQLPAGTHQAMWDGREENGKRVGSGIYLCRLWAGYMGGEFAQVQRMLLLK